MKIHASSNLGGFTVGMLNYVAPSNLKVTIFDHNEVGDAEVVFDGYLNLAIRTYPELEDCVITYLNAAGSHKLNIDIKANFSYTPAW